MSHIKFLNLGRKAVITAVLTLITVAGYFAYAAFSEPVALPGTSDQDFSQNILGVDSANNDFDSSSVVANEDGSIIERINYIKDNLPVPIDYSTFKNQIWDDWKASAVSSSGDLATAYAAVEDMNKEESTWTSETDSSLGVETIASGGVAHDARTGLYWSDCYSSAQDGTCDTRTNEFILDGVVGDADDGLDAEGGEAVDFCEGLSLDSDGNGTDETDWYLPSQKELMQAYIDGSGNNLLNPAYYFWSSTEYYSNSSYAWYVHLPYGRTSLSSKTNSYCGRCVRR